MSGNHEEDEPRTRVTFDGTRGPAFRRAKRDFLALSMGKFAKDDRYSFKLAYLKRAEGNTGQGAPALPNQQGGAGGGINQAYTAATLKKTQREGQAFKFLYESVTDENLQEMLARRHQKGG